MGVGLVEHYNPRTAQTTDLTADVDLASAEVEIQANRLNGIFDFTFRDERPVSGQAPLSIRERDEIYVSDDGVRIFGGQIATLNPVLDGRSIEYRVRAQSFDSLLDHRVIENGVRTGARSDRDDVIWILGHHPGFTDFSFVATTDAAIPDMDYSGRTLRSALDLLAGQEGTTYWIDEHKRAHWLDPHAAQKVKNAGFDVDAANWSLTGAAWDQNGGPGGTGDGAIVFDAAGESAVQTVTTVTGNRRYLASVDLRHDVSGGIGVTLEWKDAGDLVLRTDSLTHVGAGAWQRDKQVFRAPAAAVKVTITAATSQAGAGAVDNMHLIEEDAAWGVSWEPDGVTTHSVGLWRQPTDATKPINRVLVVGDGISGWREHAASIAYFGQKFEGVLKDERVSTEAGITSRANWVFRKHAFPAISGSYRTWRSGLAAGTYQIIENQVIGLVAINWIATVKAHFIGDGNLEYEVTYGEPEDDLGAALATLGSTFTGTMPEVDVEPIPEPDEGSADSVPPAVPTNLALSTGVTQADDGTHRPYLLATWDPVSDTDLDAYELQIDATDGSFTNPTTVRTGSTSHYFGDAIGGAEYAARVRAVDIWGNASAWTSTVTTFTAGDDVPPPIPENLTAIPGYRLVGLRWDRVDASDLDAYEVRWAPDDGLGNPEPTAWVTVRTATTWIVVQGLQPDITYHFQVRAIDRSGNVNAGAGVAVPADSDPEAGWSTAVTAVPVLIHGGSDIALATITADHIAVEGLDAAVLTSGTLQIGGLPGTTEFLIVYDSDGDEIGRWDQNGLLITDPINPPRQIRMVGGRIEFSNDDGATWTTAISPEGIVADAITLGTAPGGHNAIPNSSMELAAFTTVLTRIWTDATDWQGHLTGDVNLDDSTGDLRMLTVTY